MIMHYTTAFKRMFRKLTKEQQVRVSAALQLFAVDSFDPRLSNHKLSGSQEGVRSISAGYDLRILYVEEHGHTVIFLLKVGTHDAVY